MTFLVHNSFIIDIAEVSVDQCKERFKDLQKIHAERRYRDPLFETQFIVADCTKVRTVYW